ncbi:MAG: glycosyltransferase family 39 protein [Actinomycetota bacterium]|nr:glycosyltransferase family 39 protein [Actinomycetota bacterium]
MREGERPGEGSVHREGRPEVCDPPGPADRRWDKALRRRHLYLFAAVLVVYLATPVRNDSDSYYAYATAASIVHRHTLDVGTFDFPADPRLIRANDRRLNFFAWTTALTAIPAVAALDIAHLAGVGPGGDGAASRPGLVNAIEKAVGSMTAALAAVVLAVAAERLVGNAKRRGAVGIGVGLLFALTTSAWSEASRTMDEHGPSMLCLAAAFYCALAIATAADGHEPDPGRSALGLGAWLAASYVMRPTNAVLVATLGCWVLWRHRARLLSLIVGGLAVAVPWLAVTRSQYGTWLPPYFSGDRLRLHSAFLEALAGNLVSPSRGLLVYSPAIVALAVAGGVLAVRRQAVGESSRSLMLLLGAAVLVHWVAISAFPHWWGGYSYGPRFFTDLGVPLAILATPAVERLFDLRWSEGSVTGRVSIVTSAVLLVWSAFVHGEGAMFADSSCWNSRPDVDSHPDRLWDWSDPQFLAGVRAAPNLTPRSFVLGHCAAQAAPEDHR